MSLKIRFSSSTEKLFTISEINVKTAFEAQTLHMYSLLCYFLTNLEYYIEIVQQNMFLMYPKPCSLYCRYWFQCEDDQHIRQANVWMSPGQNEAEELLGGDRGKHISRILQWYIILAWSESVFSNRWDLGKASAWVTSTACTFPTELEHTIWHMNNVNWINLKHYTVSPCVKNSDLWIKKNKKNLFCSYSMDWGALYGTPRREKSIIINLNW